MGVLDEAIREHLELKRRSGADPGAVARQESEALGSRGADGPRVADLRGEGRHAGFGVLGGSDAAYEREPRRRGDLGDAGQETAELDMRTVFDDAECTTELDPIDPDHLWLERDSPPSGLLA